MRIAFITHYTELYGANRSLLNLLDGLRRGSYDVEPYIIAPAEGEVTREFSSRNIPFRILPISLWVGESGSGSNSLSSLDSFRTTLRSHCGIARRFICNAISLFPLIRQLRVWNIDLVYTNSSVIPLGAVAALLIHKPHVWHLREMIETHYGMRYDYCPRLVRRIMQSSAARIGVSEACLAYHFPRGRSGSTFVVYNGVATLEEFDMLLGESRVRQQKSEGEDYTFGIVGLIHPAKGQDIAIQGLALLRARYPNVRLIVVGGGDTSYLKELAARLGVLERVEFWGHVRNPYDAYLAVDAVITCSHSEGMGRVTVEAMSACKPVIGLASGGTPELIKHGLNGLLYYDGPAGLAKCMAQFVLKPSWAQELGFNGWRVSREKFSVEAYAKQIHDILLQVVDDASPGRQIPLETVPFPNINGRM